MSEKTTVKVGATFIFKGQLIDNKNFSSDEIKAWKLISFFPKLNTEFCDVQTLRMLEWSKKYPHVKFISLSMDKPDVAKKWCQAHSVNNLFFVSDYQSKDFANQTDFHLDNKSILKRGFMLLDEHNKIRVLTVNKILRQMPDYDLIEQNLINH